MSSSVHVHDKKRDILILGEGLRQILVVATQTAEKSIWSTLMTLGRACLSLHCNVANRYLFANDADSEIKATSLCLGDVSKDLSVDNIKSTLWNVYVYDFSVDYDAIAVDDILDIHNYLMKMYGIA